MAFRASCCSVWSVPVSCGAAVPAIAASCPQPQTIWGHAVPHRRHSLFAWQDVTQLTSFLITVPCSIAKDSAANDLESNFCDIVFKMSRDAFDHSLLMMDLYMVTGSQTRRMLENFS